MQRSTNKKSLTKHSSLKLKVCSSCQKEKPIWKRVRDRENGDKLLCKTCSLNAGVARSSEAKPKVKHSRIPFKSSKQSKLEIAYSALRRVYLKEYPMCRAHLTGCTLISVEVHHKRGRGEYLLDTSTWLPVCRNDHSWIENHPEEAIVLGFSELRLKTDGC